MVNRSFFSLGRPKLRYAGADGRGMGPVAIPLPPRVSVKIDWAGPENLGLGVSVGTKVRTGQRVELGGDGPQYFISPATGTVALISPLTGYLGLVSTLISIDVTGEDKWDGEFGVVSPIPSLGGIRRYLGSLPGQSDLGRVLDIQPAIRTFIISCMDRDLLTGANQTAVARGSEDLREGIRILRKVTKAEKVILLLPKDLSPLGQGSEAEVKSVDPIYPEMLPRLAVKKYLGREVPAGRQCEDLGIGFLRAEAVIALARAYREKKIPVQKALTVVGKDGTRTQVVARVGTPVKDILEAVKVETVHGDKVIMGGPMTGRSLFSGDEPISWDTDGILVQGQGDGVGYSDSHCVNCGECVRACPAKVPVNMLIRYLENRLYEDAVAQYDLLSCVECGLCSFVCIAHIPLFQYIMLGKNEYAVLKSAEGSNE